MNFVYKVVWGRKRFIDDQHASDSCLMHENARVTNFCILIITITINFTGCRSNNGPCTNWL